jgi:cysteine desulfurase/selenocysteine lyase
LERIKYLIDENSRLIAVTHVSNVLGTINPVKEIVSLAKSLGLVTLVDGAQAVMHTEVDVRNIGCDFYVFSGHKVYGPTGIGVLYGNKSTLEKMPPWQGGGSMIRSVSLDQGSTWNELPWCFEAGTPNIAGIIGLGAAIDYVNKIGLEAIHHREATLTDLAMNTLSSVPNIKIYGPEKNRTGIISFNLGRHHAYDIGSLLDNYGIAIRTGHHCAMPLMEYYNISSMCRVSFSFYNSEKEVEQLALRLVHINHILNNGAL